MASNLVSSIIRRRSRLELVIALVTTAFMLAAVGLAQNYYHNQFNGPFPVSKQELLDIDNLMNVREYHITIEGDRAALIGNASQSSASSFSSRDVNYVALALDDRFLLVEVPGNPITVRAEFDPTSTRFTGALVRIPSDVQQEVIDTIVALEPEVKGRFLPFMLNSGDFGTWGYLTPFVAGIAIVTSLWIGIRAVRRMRDYSRHPIMRKLARFGDAVTIAEAIELDMQQDHEIVGQKAHLTRHWLVYPTRLWLEATKFADVMWMYEQVIQKQRNFIPTNKIYAALIWDRYGNCIKIPCKQEMMHAILSAVARRSPGAIKGYQTSTDVAWNNDREAFIEAVDKRRAEAR
jgi:hypothetical protein